MKQAIVIILKKIGLFRYIKDIKDTIEYYLTTKESYYKQMDILYANFDLKDKMVYDIGAADDGVESFIRSGASKVIGIEPSERLYKRLLKKYKHNNNVQLLNIAIGSENTKKEMIVCNSRYFSTFSEDQVNIIKNHEGCKNLEFYKKEEVKMCKLDTIIEKYGLPYFCKIDVEGYEFEVFSGLSKKIPLISFEYNTSLIEKTERCILLLEKLGEYEFNFADSTSEDMRCDRWINSEKIIKELRNLDNIKMTYGDVYARLKIDDVSEVETVMRLSKPVRNLNTSRGNK